MTTLRTRLAAAMLAALPAAAFAAPPVACEILKADDINPIAERKVEKFRLQKSGNPTECGFFDSRNSAVLVVNLKEVQYAVKDELDVERGNLEKVYKVKAKPIDTVGEGGFWLAANKTLFFRKGKVIGSVTFQTPRNQNEIDTSQIARVVESRLK